ncbi:MMPL family transporter [Actinomadura keratinilytica]
MSSAARKGRTARILVPLVLLIAWLGIGGTLGPYAGKLGEVATNDQAAFLPQSAESTRVSEEQKAFSADEALPALVVWTAKDGGRLPADAREAATGTLASLADADFTAGRPSPALASKDGEALEGVVPLRTDLDELQPVLDEIKEAAGKVPGTEAVIAGPAASQADLSDAFAGIDGLLLGVALIAVLLILLVVYRSVLLPLVIIFGAVLALGLACAVVYALAQRDVVRVDGQVQGILSILVIGAATDYALLLTARFREELSLHGDRFTAMRLAWRQSFGPITASAATVALGLLALLLSDLTNNRALGPVGAIGIVCSVFSALTFLPAALVLLGRAAYWLGPPQGHRHRWQPPPVAAGRGPGRPDAAQGLGDHPGRPRGLRGLRPDADQPGRPAGRDLRQRRALGLRPGDAEPSLPGRRRQPGRRHRRRHQVDEVVAAAEKTEGVASVAPVTESGRPGGGAPRVVDGRVRIDATLQDGADSDAAKETVARLRTAVHAVDGADAVVGGYTAQQYDTQRTAEADRNLIMPVVLAIILVILIALLRSLVTPLLLVLTVALNFAATLGIASLVFTHVFGFSGTDASVPLYGFVFLVALGVDYNIFLMSRVREETALHGSREGVRRGLTTTGGVITSAGVVLAATFAALGVIPLAFLAQIAFIVAFGVLLDTLVVRSLLVPALVRDIGSASWWPGALSRRAEPAKEAAGEPRTPA